MISEWIFALKANRKYLVRHVLLWIVYYLLFTFVMSFVGDYKKYLLLNILNISVYIFAYYTLRYIVIPKFFQKGSIVRFILVLIFFVLLTYCLYWAGRIFWLEKVMSLSPDEPFTLLNEFLIKILRFYSPALLLLVWEFQHTKKQSKIRRQAIAKEQLKNELAFLKAQINPHFLFNTLNNLYSFVVTKSPKASEMLQRLTSILDYVLNQGKDLKVSLQKEITAIEHYLELEKIRYGDRLSVSYQTSCNFNTNISPLILLSIIENAFKHGASGDIDQPKIKIDLYTDKNILSCLVWNTKSKYQGELNDEYKKGIGLSNIKRQLNLIYPDKHDLKIEDKENSFSISLKINTE